MIYRSKCDGRSLTLIVSLFTYGCLMLCYFKPLPFPFAEYYGWFFILVGVLAFWDYATTSYEINGAELTIRSGPGCKRIRLDCIEHLKRQRGLWSLLTFSTGPIRMRYRYGLSSGTVVVRPEDEEEFLNELTVLSPWLSGP